MDGKSLVTRIALLIIGFSLFSVIFWGVFVGSRGMAGNIVGLVINVVLAFFLMAGHGWARWWMSIRCGIGAITSFASWSGLAQHDFSFFSVIRVWLLVSAIFFAAIAVYLMLSKRVNEHFNPGSGF
jgi:hypothetical protein